MPSDSLEDDTLSFLSLRDRDILERLAEMDLRTPVDELRYLIRAQAFGQDRIVPRLSEDDLADFLTATSLALRKGPSEPDDRVSAVHKGPK